MIQDRRLRYILIAFLAVLLLIPIAYSVWRVQGTVSWSESSISCSLSGAYIKTTHADGTVEWSPSKPTSATITASGTATGMGRAWVELASGSLNGSSVDSEKDGGKVGQQGVIRQIPIIPVYSNGDRSLSASDSFDNLPLSEGTYTWSASAKFEKSNITFNGLYWVDEAVTHTSNTVNGSWTIIHMDALIECDGCTALIPSYDEYHAYEYCHSCQDFYWKCASTADDHINGECNTGAAICERCLGEIESEDYHAVKTCTRKTWDQVRWGPTWRRVRVTCGEEFSDCDNPSTCYGNRVHTD